MSIGHRKGGAGFTLLEIVLAVAILGMMSLAIYRFVQSNVTAVRFSAEASALDAQYDGLTRLLTTEWTSLPRGVGALQGEPLKTNNRSRDEIAWICGPGPGLLTRHAVGQYSVSLRLRPAKGSDALVLGLAREPYNPEKKIAGPESWVPLLEGVESLQIRYFDARVNTWVDKWTDPNALPQLVRVMIGRSDSPAWETIIALARTPYTS